MTLSRISRPAVWRRLASGVPTMAVYCQHVGRISCCESADHKPTAEAGQIGAVYGGFQPSNSRPGYFFALIVPNCASLRHLVRIPGRIK